MKKNTILSLVLLGTVILQGLGELAYAGSYAIQASTQTNSLGTTNESAQKLTYNGKEISLDSNGNFILNGKKAHIDSNGNITYNGSSVGNISDFPGLILINQATTVNNASL